MYAQLLKQNEVDWVHDVLPVKAKFALNITRNAIWLETESLNFLHLPSNTSQYEINTDNAIEQNLSKNYSVVP